MSEVVPGSDLVPASEVVIRGPHMVPKSEVVTGSAVPGSDFVLEAEVVPGSDLVPASEVVPVLPYSICSLLLCLEWHHKTSD